MFENRISYQYESRDTRVTLARGFRYINLSNFTFYTTSCFGLNSSIICVFKV